MRVLATMILSLVLTVPALTGCSSEQPAADVEPAATTGQATATTDSGATDSAEGGGSAKKSSGSGSK